MNDHNEMWHKSLVLCLQQLGIVEMLILPETMQKLVDAKPEDQLCAIVDQQERGVLVRIATVKQAQAYLGMTTDEERKTIIQ